MRNHNERGWGENVSLPGCQEEEEEEEELLEMG
jgi:hypothetical protein